MLTPQEIKEKKFSKAVFGGYDMTEVDDFLDGVLADYATLFKESAVLKGKLKVLVETVEEYRSVDTSMRKALLAAQKMASEMTEEAKQKSSELLSRAEAEANEQLERIERDIQAETDKLEAARRETTAYIASMIEFCRRQIGSFERIGMPVPEAPPETNAVEETAADITNSVISLFEEERIVAPEREVAPPEPAEDISVDDTPLFRSDIAPVEPLQTNAEPVFIADDTSDDDSGDTVTFPSVEPPLSEVPRNVSIGGMNIQIFEAELSGDDEDEGEDISF